MIDTPLTRTAALTARARRAPLAHALGVLGSALLAAGACLYGALLAAGLGVDGLGGAAPALLVAGAAAQVVGWAALQRRFELGAGPMVGAALAPVVLAILWAMPEASDSRALISLVVLPLALAASAFVTSGALADGWGFSAGRRPRGLARTALFCASLGLIASAALGGAPAGLQLVALVLGYGALATGQLATAATMAATA